MLLDKQNQFSDAQAVTDHTADTPSSNVIDLGIARDVGGSVTAQLHLLCEVSTAFASGGSATLQVKVQGSNDNSSFVDLYASPAVAVASLAQGYRFLPGPLIARLNDTLYRYVRLDYVVGTADMTAGRLTAALVPSLVALDTYARGYTA
jgi:hypothetical protein